MMPIKQYVQALPKACLSDPYLRNALDLYLKDVRSMTQTDIETFLSGFASARAEQEKDNTVHYPSSGEALRKALDFAQRLCMQNLADGDDPVRTQRIIALMLAVCSMTDWVTQGKFERRFDADLATGDTTALIALLYAMVKEHCTQPQREQITQALLEKGIKPIYGEWLSPQCHWHALDTMGHNWWLVIICGAGIAAMVLHDTLADYDLYMDAVLEGTRQWFAYPGNVLQNKKANFGPDGDFIEFTGYLTYGLSNYVIMEDMHRMLYGTTYLYEEEKLEKLIDYYIVHDYEVDGRVYSANFGDTPQQQAKHQHTVYWLMNRFGRGDFFYIHKKLSPGPNQLFDFLYYPGIYGLTESPDIHAPLFSMYRHAGYAVMRTGYGSEDTFFAVKTGESWNHNHLDVGTFLLVAGGKPIAVDSGMCSYHRPEYRGYYTTPQAHNVVLFNGQGEDPDTIHSGTKFAGSFPASLDADSRGFRYLLADCCGAYTNIYPRFYRHILFLDGVILFVDDIQTYEDGQLSWLMHFDGALRQDGSAPAIDVDGVTATLHPLYPAVQALETGKAWRSEIHGGPEDGKLPEGQFLSLTSPITDRRAKLIQAIQLPGTELSMDMQTDGTVIEITIARDGQVEKVYCNTLADGSVMHKNSNVAYKDISTDAFIVYTKTTNDTITDTAMINGSGLCIGGDFVCGAMVKLDVHLNLSSRVFVSALCMDASVHLGVGGDARRVDVEAGQARGTW